MNIDKFSITSWDVMSGFNRGTGNLDFVVDELTDFTLGQTQEDTPITGKGGRQISTLKKNKAVNGSGTNGMLSGGLLAAQVGTDVEDGEYDIRYTDVIIVNGNEGETLETAIGTAGNEIGTIYVRDENQVYISGGTKLTQTAGEPTKGTFSYDPATKKIKFSAGEVADGVEVIAIYNVKKSGKKITNDAEHYSQVLELIIDVTCQDACDNVFHGQFLVDRADFSGEFDLSGGSDPSTHAFSFTSLPNVCTGKTKLWDFIVFD